MPTAAEPPPGYHTVTPRVVVDDVEATVEFLRAAFDATGDAPAGRPAELRIGDSLVLVSETGPRDSFPAFLYLYVDDADHGYRRAIDAGATSLERRSTPPTATGGPWCATRSATCSRSRRARRAPGPEPRAETADPSVVPARP